MMAALRWLFGVTWGKEEERKEASLPAQEEGNTPQQEGRRRKRKKEPTERKREDDRGEEVDFGDKKMTEAQYLRKRRFRFLHYYAGTEDPLGKALRAEAERHNMKVTVVSCEKEGPDGVDLLKEEPFNEHCQLAKEGRWDGFHSGFPCTSYSRLRWRPSGSYPGPCRSKEHPYGMPTNSEKLQRECDEGTLHAARSALIGRYILWEREDHTVRPVVTLENPPPSELENHLSAWELGEVKELVEGFNFVSANFTSCKFQMDIPRGERYYKPQRISGTLRGLTSLSGGCPCGRGAVHVPVVGKDVSQASGKYPQALCEAYASLVIEHFKKMASEEFVRRRARVMEEELTRLRDIKRKKESQAESAKAAFDTTVGQKEEGQESSKGENKQPTKEETSSEEESVPEEVMKRVGKELPGTTAERRSRSRTPLRRKRTETGPKAEAKEADTSKAKSGNPASSSRGSEVRGTTPEEQSEGAGRAHSLEWKGGTGAYGMLKGSKAKTEDPARLDFLGGMRNPAEVVKGMPNGQALGEEVYKAWQAYVRKDKRALKAAETYGTPECILDPNTVGSWRAELRRLTESKGKQSAVLKQKYEYRSPLVGDIVEAWTRKARDPDTPLTKWIADGVPLGINLPIEMTGVFPKAEKDQEAEIQTDALQQMSRGDIANYTSVLENMEDAKIEVDRLVAKKIALRVSKAEVEHHFSQGTISRLALIVKERPDHTKKRRLIIDLKRSGGNSKASLPERLILPRAQDVMSTAKELRRLQPEEASEQADWAREMVLVDVSDAFPHLGVHGKELEHCLAPDIEGSGYLLFRALLFGYKTAPLLWSRLAAWVARLLQSCIPLHVGQHQVYLDDSCWMLQGTLRERTTALAFIIYTMAALGLEVSIKKGERGAQVTWAGLHFRLISRDEMLLTLPEKFLADLQTTLESLASRGMAPIRELRSITGKISWLAGALPRTRWLVRIFYAVLTAREAELRTGEEEKRRRERTDSRVKEFLFPVKRLERARLTLLQILATVRERPTRKVSLKRQATAKATILTDASPEGLGAVLIVNGKVLGALASPVMADDARALQFALGESSSQGIVEALAAVYALFHWGGKLAGLNVDLTFQADSITALAVLHKKSAGSPTLNFLGATLSIFLERFRIEQIMLQHVPGVANKVADYLSRPSSWSTESLPSELHGIEISTGPSRHSGFYPLPTPGEAPDLWGAASMEEGTSPWPQSSE